MENYSIYGVSFDFVDIDDSTQRETVPGQTYEPAVMSLLRNVFTQHGQGTFLDIGALYGYFSCYVAKLAPGVKVVAFEPSRRSAEVAQMNFKLNGISNVTLETVALASGKRQQEFIGKTLVKDRIDTGRTYAVQTHVKPPVVPVSNSDVTLGTWLGASVRHLLRLAMGWNRKEVVECTTFDENYDHLADRPIVAKIDVHGAEVSVLAGMQRYLREKVDLLLVELHRDDMLVEGTHADTVDILRGSGLTLYEIVDFRTEGWRLEKLTEARLSGLRSSKHWSLRDKAVMKMVLGVREGVIDVENNWRVDDGGGAGVEAN